MSKQQAEEWAEEFLHTHRKIFEKISKQYFNDSLIYGDKPISENIIEKYKDVLTEEEIKALNNYGKIQN